MASERDVYMERDLSLEQRRKLAFIAVYLLQMRIQQMADDEFAYQLGRSKRERASLEGLSEEVQEELKLFTEEMKKNMEGIVDSLLEVKWELGLSSIRAMLGSEATEFAVERIRSERPRD